MKHDNASAYLDAPGIAALLTVIAGVVLLLYSGSPPDQQADSTVAPQVPSIATDHPPAEQPLSLIEGSDRAIIPIEAISIACAVPGTGEYDQAKLFEALARENERLQRELAHCQSPQDTVEGALIRLPEYSALKPNALHALRGALDELPVHLLPGEARWIAERYELDDWPEPPLTAIIRYLGGERVANEIPKDKLDALRQWYEPNEWRALFGNR